MKWSWKIGRFSGIDVYVHATFLILVSFFGLIHYKQGGTLAAAMGGVTFIVALFTCVLAHEFGHSFAARKFGIKTRDITLLPIGGVARLEKMPEEPSQELWVALAGPAVNVFIAMVLFAFLQATDSLRVADSLSLLGGSFLEQLAKINLVLAIFNLLPAFPMDGGRVLRAFLATRMEYSQATQFAASVGQLMAFVFGFFGLFFNPFLLFIALFVFIGAAQEASAVQMKTALGGIPVSQAMLTDFKTLAPNDSLKRAVELVLSGSQQDFPVVLDNQVVGILLRNDMIAALAQKGEDTYVSEIMRREFQTLDSHDMLETSLQRLQECNCHTVPVVHSGQLVGLVTMENIGEFMMIQSARKSARSFTGHV